METKNFLGLDGLKRFWEKAKLWIINEITSKIAEIVAEAPEDLDTLKEISDWISTHKDSASAMNTNIIKNQSDINELNNKLSSIEQTNFKAIFDLVRPIGDTYVQYPQQANPNELWGAFSTWEVIDYDGAFFRAEGTNANAFIEKTGVLSKQGQSIQSHKHSASFSGNQQTGEVYLNNNTNGGSPIRNCSGIFSSIGSAPINLDSGKWTSVPAGFRLSITPSGSVSIDETGSTETKPANYTIRVWKRTA